MKKGEGFTSFFSFAKGYEFRKKVVDIAFLCRYNYSKFVS